MLATITAADGRPVAWVSPAADGSPDPVMAAAVARYLARETAEQARRDAIRSGAMPPEPPAARLLISDRH